MEAGCNYKKNSMSIKISKYIYFLFKNNILCIYRKELYYKINNNINK